MVQRCNQVIVKTVVTTKRHSVNSSLILFATKCIVTFRCLVPSSPQNFSLSPVAGSPTQLSASWSVPIPRNGIITAYSVYCNTSANQAYPEQVIGQNDPTIRSGVNGTTLATTLTGLNPYTQYSCYVTANTSVGEGSPSAVVTALTTESGNSTVQHYVSIVMKARTIVDTTSIL